MISYNICLSNTCLTNFTQYDNLTSIHVTADGNISFCFMPVNVYLGLLRWHSGEKPACQCRRHRRHELDPWVEKIPWCEKWLYPCLENSMDRGTWGATVHGFTESDLTEHTHTHTVFIYLSIYLLRLLYPLICGWTPRLHA